MLSENGRKHKEVLTNFPKQIPPCLSSHTKPRSQTSSHHPSVHNGIHPLQIREREENKRVRKGQKEKNRWTGRESDKNGIPLEKRKTNGEYDYEEEGEL